MKRSIVISLVLLIFDFCGVTHLHPFMRDCGLLETIESHSGSFHKVFGRSINVKFLKEELKGICQAVNKDFSLLLDIEDEDFESCPFWQPHDIFERTWNFGVSVAFMLQTKNYFENLIGPKELKQACEAMEMSAKGTSTKSRRREIQDLMDEKTLSSLSFDQSLECYRMLIIDTLRFCATKFLYNEGKVYCEEYLLDLQDGDDEIAK